MGRMWLNVEETAKGYNFSAVLKEALRGRLGISDLIKRRVLGNCILREIISEVLNEKTNNSDYRKKVTEMNRAAIFTRYPFSAMAIIDLLSILPSISALNNSFKALRILRLIRAMKVLKVFRMMRYSKSFKIIKNVMKASKESLIAVCALAAAYRLISALIIFDFIGIWYCNCCTPCRNYHRWILE